MELSIVIMGLAVGFLVGLTGVGGAALLTPVLLWAGISPTVAVGTDLLYNSITKLFGIVQHYRQRTIHFGLVRDFAYGSIPGAIAAIAVLKFVPFGSPDAVVKHALGMILVIVALVTLARTFLPEAWFRSRLAEKPPEQKRALTIAIGVVLGFVVGLTSIGSGSLFAVALIYLYRLGGSQIVGTDIAHAFLLVTVAGALHAGLGHVDYMLALNLLIGSVPGVLIGSTLSAKIPTKPLRGLIAALLLLSGLKLI